MKNQRGITLISLVITIVVLIILAGVAISMTLGENGIFTKAQEAKKMQAIGTAKEQIGLEILEAQIEAMENNEELEQSQVEAIVAKYGELQSDGDTIILNDTEYEVSLREIYNEMAEEEGDETTELAQLKALLSQTTVTEDKILKDYKAYKDGQLITGTMENYAGQTVEATEVTESGENALITIPEEGHYSTSSKISVPISEISSNINDKIFEDISNPAFAGIGDAAKGTSTITSDVLEAGTYIVTCSTGHTNDYTLTTYSVQANETDEVIELYKSDYIQVHSQRHYVFIYKVKLNTSGQITFTATTDLANVNQRSFMHCTKIN